ncbi:MAG: biotin-dependent carboxyltransferase family protein [Gammaproteobacteria bacterium]|nr:biotin-dependent carboxyltransferase family protein [Gammaproteobacteria bacterium]
MVIVNPGVYASIQDLGRYGVASWGIGHSGAADRLAVCLIQRALGNAVSVPVLEIMRPPAQLLFTEGAWVCLGGADTHNLARTLDEERVLPMYAPSWLPAGTELQMGRPRAGAVAYVAVAGGFEVLPRWGSAATDLRAGCGERVSKGMRLRIRGGMALPHDPTRLRVASRYPAGLALCDIFSGGLDVLPGPDFTALDPEARRHLLGQTFEVSARSDRMGLRFVGEPVGQTLSERISAGVCHGAVQLPPDGLPIVLGPEHQTTGGYPLPLVVCSHHHSRLAQLAPGDKIRFQLLQPHQAEAQRLRVQQRLARLRLPCLPLSPSWVDSLKETSCEPPST